ncbi:uncharacterized protein DC041_0003587 [Schistosoma bovis]|uniref:Thioredoxin domain-containing protein n=1 Tax=Schistosoma bovis TaxID=6184 RepID=A0A430QN05_SCHBO|nr:uncharacterized protein DC041_0003587 [Schistosoma bovis]
MEILKHVLGFLVFLKFCSPYVIQLNSTNWKQMLDGEWLVKFHAPWCPACRQFSPIWQQLSDDSSINAFVADVDVTESPVLSFIFFVKRLPTVYHMHIFIRFMDLGIFITNTHQAFLDAGYSNWMSFLIIGLSTIFSGLFIGIILVLIFDCFFPPRPQILRFIRKPKKVEESLLHETEKSKSDVHDDDVSEENVDDEITEIRQRKVDNNEVHDS